MKPANYSANVTTHPWLNNHLHQPNIHMNTIKTFILLPIFTLIPLCACSHHDSYRSVSEAAAITASDIQKVHQEANTTLDKIAEDMASSINNSRTNSHSASTASLPTQ